MQSSSNNHIVDASSFPFLIIFNLGHIFPSVLITPSQNLSVLVCLHACFSNTLPQGQYAPGDFGTDCWNSCASLVKFGYKFVDYLQGCLSTCTTVLSATKHRRGQLQSQGFSENMALNSEV